MKFTKTAIDGVVIVEPDVFGDHRGFFMESWSKRSFEEAGLYYDFVQDNHSSSTVKGTLRGIHFQRGEWSQAKLVRCICGHVFDVVVDLRRDSPTFRQWLGFELTGEKHNEILVPEGCAHGYLVLEPSVVSYKCGEKFYGEYDDGILWNDPDIAVAWPLERIGGVENVILADKDRNLQTFRQFMESYGGF